jgi:mRNA interferase RelE/StbE
MASYQVEVSDRVRKEIRLMPGNVRQQALRALRALEQDPRPHTSRPLDVVKVGIALEAEAELRRIRLASWRIVYLVEEEWKLISVLAIRKRPPYQYDDLDKLAQSG